MKQARKSYELTNRITKLEHLPPFIPAHIYALWFSFIMANLPTQCPLDDFSSLALHPVGFFVVALHPIGLFQALCKVTLKLLIL